jgi:tetratricopeptide (TPR) repeat protein
MSFFGRLLGQDPEQLVQKGERALADGHPAAAMDLFQRAVERGVTDGDLAQRARQGATQAASALVQLNVAEARLSLEAGDPEGAQGHLDTALQLSTDDGQREAIAALQLQVDEAVSGADEPQRLFTDVGAVDVEDEPPEIEWRRLLDTLDEDWAEDYDSRGTPFRDAVLTLNDGRPEEAVEALAALIDAQPDDPVLRFERGRALMVLERYADALEDLTFARKEIGFEPLDHVGSVQIGALEIEALLALGRPGEARALAQEAIDDQGEQVNLLFVRGQAERALEQYDAMEQTFSAVTRLSPRLVEAAQMLAEARLRRGELREAAQALEDGIKRHCGTGTCQLRPMSVEAGRLLARVYLDLEEKPAKVEDLLLQVRGTLEGDVQWVDHLLWARLHHRRGDLEAFAAAKKAGVEALPPRLRQSSQTILDQLGVPE